MVCSWCKREFYPEHSKRSKTCSEVCWLEKRKKQKVYSYQKRKTTDAYREKIKINQKKYREANKDRVREKAKILRLRKKDQPEHKVITSGYRKKQASKSGYKEKKALSDRKYYNKNKEKVKSSVSSYQKNNPSKVKIWLSSRKKVFRLATPKWLTRDQFQEMNNLYWLAKDLRAVSGQEYHVDHIVPLQGVSVCGLHVPWNLQILPADINLSKGNREKAIDYYPEVVSLFDTERFNFIKENLK